MFKSLKKKFQLFVQVWVVEKWLLGRKLDHAMMVLLGPIYFQSASAALRLNLFTILAKVGPLSKEEIAKQIGLELKPAVMLIRVLVTIDLLKRVKKNGEVCYMNTVIAKVFLDKNEKTNVIDMIEWYHHIVYKPMFWFYESLKANTNIGLKEIPGSGNTLYERLTNHPELERIFENAMEQISLTTNKMMAQFVDLSQIKNLLDVGGGNGTNIMALVRENPHLKARVFDSPTVCKLAQENIRKYGMEESCQTVPGNCFIDPFPKVVDGILFSHFMAIWSEEQNALLARKSYEALPPGGQVIILENLMNDNEHGPYPIVALGPYFLALASGHAHIYTSKDYHQWLFAAGFRRIKFLRLPQDHMAIIGYK